MYIRFRIIILVFFIFSLGQLWSQSINTEFGKNRIQYHDDHYNWSRYETENFMTYWYGKSRNIAQTTIQLSELDHNEVQKILEHTLSDKIEIIVYIDLSDMKQSNIGLDQAFNNKADYTTVEGNKILVYFDGDHQNLRQQIRRGIATVYLNSILYGSSLQEIVQNALLLSLPPWFSEGIVNYAASNWNHEIDDELRDLLDKNDNYSDFEKLAQDHPRVAGHSLWNYIAEEFGSATIPNLIYLTRISRSFKNSFLFVLGVDYEVIISDWYSHYWNKYSKEIGQFTDTDSLTQLKLKNKKGVPISQYRYSSDSRYLAYVINDRSKVRVNVRDMQTGEIRTILKEGSKNIFQETDFNYPLICWHPSYPELSIIYEHRDIVYLRKVDIKLNTSEEDLMTTNFQRIYSLDQVEQEKYILSASTDGYSDLYLYDSNSRHHTRITEDFYDDLEASVINYRGEPGILFRSNRAEAIIEKARLDTIIPVDNFDVFILAGLDNEAELIRVTDTEHISERAPLQSAAEQLMYLTEVSGVSNIYAHDLTTGKKRAITNVERNVINYSVDKRASQLVLNYYYHGNYDNFLIDYDEDTALQPFRTELATKLSGTGVEVQIPFLPEPTSDEAYEPGMSFQSNFEDVADLQPIEESDTADQESNLFDKYFRDYFSDSYLEGKRVIKFNPMRATASRERFRLDNFITRMDNSVLFEGLESYVGDDKNLATTPVGLLLKGEITDLFEDYRIDIGLRLPTRFNGQEYFVTIDDNKRQWDKRLAIYRKSTVDVRDLTVFPAVREKRKTTIGLYRLKYPIDVYQSLRFTGSLRFDKYFNLSTDVATFEAPFTREKRISLKAEYVFDNSYDVLINIKNGSRIKFYSEAINEFDLDFDEGVNLDLSKSVTGIFGFDARHYIPVIKKAVLALRAAGATSIGSRRVVYNLGGMESWILPSMEENIPLPEGDGNAFKVLAPQLRGFKHNIRNGNTYLLSNAEFRLPVFSILGLDKSRFGFFRNMQVTGFFDAGLAWYGLNPEDERNTLNSIFVANPEENPVVIVDARYFRDPLVYGYGFGLRTTMLSYFVKFDFAWGKERGRDRLPRAYLSLGYDF